MGASVWNGRSLARRASQAGDLPRPGLRYPASGFAGPCFGTVRLAMTGPLPAPGECRGR